ncbi:SRPBCC family protein [Qaidamihabitans albus]|uniref:SRPBCC family protein n=1 Tax=Qaidamihabitans albus TaxID=2795733 RepID=UPI0018F23BB0|nr:SRPBCC family protein [Qaidamihabitans albus]
MIIQHSIDVRVPARTAYNQWTQFETFPRFVDGVEKLLQRTDTQLHGRADVEGRHTFDIDITDQVPDERISWRSAQGPEHSGTVTFHRTDDERCRIDVEAVVPEGTPDSVDRFVEDGLAAFKEYIERRGSETGAWRGKVVSGRDGMPHVLQGGGT